MRLSNQVNRTILGRSSMTSEANFSGLENSVNSDLTIKSYPTISTCTCPVTLDELSSSDDVLWLKLGECSDSSQVSADHWVRPSYDARTGQTKLEVFEAFKDTLDFRSYLSRHKQHPINRAKLNSPGSIYTTKAGRWHHPIEQPVRSLIPRSARFAGVRRMNNDNATIVNNPIVGGGYRHERLTRMRKILWTTFMCLASVAIIGVPLYLCASTFVYLSVTLFSSILLGVFLSFLAAILLSALFFFTASFYNLI